MLTFFNQWAGLPCLILCFEMHASVFWGCCKGIVLPFQRWWKCSRYIGMDGWDGILLHLSRAWVTNWFWLGRTERFGGPLQCFRCTFTKFTHLWSIAGRSIEKLWTLSVFHEVFVEEQPHHVLIEFSTVRPMCEFSSSREMSVPFVLNTVSLTHYVLKVVSNNRAKIYTATYY